MRFEANPLTRQEFADVVFTSLATVAFSLDEPAQRGEPSRVNVRANACRIDSDRPEVVDFVVNIVPFRLAPKRTPAVFFHSRGKLCGVVHLEA